MVGPCRFQKDGPLQLEMKRWDDTEGEEGLREIGFDAICLVVNVMVDRVIAEQELERIPGKVPPTMIIN
jgi:hypothetical protein